MAMFKEAADIKTSDQLHLPVPDAKFETVVVKPSEIQQDMVQALSERAAEVHSGSVDPSVDNIEEFVSAGCCILIFISNVAVLFLLERMEYAASEREQLLMLNQQIQLQSKNMTSASELYSAQRKKVHDFRSHLNILNQLMKNQEYSAAEEYLEKITEQQTDRLFLVNTHHPILDALFNTKAAEATQKKNQY